MKKTFALWLALVLLCSLCITAVAINIGSIETEDAPLIAFNSSAEFLDFSPSEDENHQPTVLRLPLAGMSTFLRFDDIYDETKVEYTSSNDNVVTAFDGRILAMGVGTATITIHYENLSQNVVVIVEDQLTPEEVEQSIPETASANSTEMSQRVAIVQRALDMVNYQWIPARDLVKWNKQEADDIFPAGVVVTGIPYSQTENQCNVSEFDSALDNSETNNFYDNDFMVGTKIAPRYGNDCSGFVCIAWQLPHRTGKLSTWNFEENYTPLSGYAALQKGDAVVTNIHTTTKRKNHIILVSVNESDAATPYVLAYEQTPPKTTMTFLTYDQLAEYEYIPISSFS